MRAFLICLFAMLLAWPQQSQAEPVDSGHALAEIISERESIVPGDRFLAGLKLEIDDKWHVYWRNAGDAGIAPSIRWEDKAGAEMGEFVWPAPHTIPLEGLMNYGYGDVLVLPFEIIVPDTLEPGDTLTLTGKGEWQICLDICIWEDADLSLTLPVGDMPVTHQDSANDIAAALALAPQELTGDAFVERQDDLFRLAIVDDMFAATLDDAVNVRFFPFEHDINHFPEQPLTYSQAGGVLTLEASSMAPEGAVALGGVVVVEQADGERSAFELTAQPGVIPAGLDSDTFTPGASNTGGASAGILQILTWLGFGLIGGLVLNLMPCVLPVLSIKANGLIQAAGEGDESVKNHGLAYFAGVVSCFLAIGIVMVALRAAGEQAGLGFQLQYPPIVLGLAFLMFLVGLNLLGVFEIGTSLTNAGAGLAHKQGTSGAFFTGLLAAVVGAPCVGPFLAASLGAVVTSQPAWIVILFMLCMGIGMAAPFLLLSLAPGLARLLPRPGRWMETVKHILAFPMFLTAVGLLWVFAGQAGTDLTMLALAGAVLIAFGIWAMKHASGRMLGAVGGLVLAIGLVAPITWSAFAVTPTASEQAGTSHDGAERAAWSPQKVAELQAAGQPFFVDFTARWCVTCQFNKKTALETSAVQAFFAENNIVFLTADWTNRDEVIAAELAAHDRAGVPLYLFYAAGSKDPVTLPQLLRAQSVIKTLRAEM